MAVAYTHRPAHRAHIALGPLLHQVLATFRGAQACALRGRGAGLDKHRHGHGREEANQWSNAQTKA